MFNRNLQKETGKRFTKWSLRRIGKQTASVVVASGLFLSISQPALAQVIIASQTEAITTTVPADSSSTSQTTTPTTTVEAPVTSEEQPNATVPQTEVPVQKDTPSETQAPQEVEKAEEAAVSNDAAPHHDAVKKAVAHNFKDVVNVPAEWLDAAKADGPFTAGVNQIIPFEFFGGDGMLTRLLLKSSDKAPWSDNGTAKHPFLLPFDKLEKGKYFYEVDLDGNASGKKDGALLAQLKKNGTHSYKATVKVYAAKDGKADTSHVVATKTATINLKAIDHHSAVKNAVAHNFKDVVNVPAEWLDAAKADGPFTAGVNQIIPFEFFGGDGMLTRLLLKSSDKAPWSDNGTAKHPFLLPFDKLEKGKYFYEVDLDGNVAGKKDGALLAQLKKNGTHSYKATVKVYAAKDGKADTSHVVATKTATINLKAVDHHDAVKNAVAHNFKDVVNVPAEWLDAAKADGPFTAGVNQIIPFEFFGGDGMLTRLLLKSSDKAPWSDNGTAKHPFLLPFDKLENGKYFYEVDLDGNAAGKKDGELLAQLKKNGTHSYKATVKVYAAKDGKADTSHVVATKTATINLKGTKQKAPKHDQKNEVIKPVYRLYHSGLKTHLYTTSVNERDTLTKRGWKYEGVAWNTTTKTGAPVYRLYHSGLRVHLYTKDANEYKVLGTRGWRQEGIAYRSNGKVPVYRLYHAGIKKHHYTKNANEYKVLGTRGWKQEGIAWYSEK